MTEQILNASAASIQKTSAAANDSPKLAKAKEAAQDFEAIFLSQMLATMSQELGGAGGVAGGDEVYRDMFNKEVAKMISRSGGIGVADAVLQEMLKVQEID
jgi:Rod binding domain-containing protein